ncbi:Solute carrier family 26 member 6 [Merluccius polli]|uniref:Solute carrier family 26 member 6 n=1 Tax=Merluccius polli TaxID=89951 RepID=A0AA47NNI6_MERPO|nr:Solute carrier family 26 member 6 [Merluccius polli]
MLLLLNKRWDQMSTRLWVTSLVSTLVFNLDLGLAVSAAFSLLVLVYRTQQSSGVALLGQVPTTDCYKDLSLYSEVKQVPGVTVLSCSSPLYFANSERVFTDIRQKVTLGHRENCAVVQSDRFSSSSSSSSSSLAGTPAHTHCLVLDLNSVSFLDSVATAALWKLVWVTSLVSTLVFNLDLGLAVSAAFSLLVLVYRTQQSSGVALLGQVPTTDCVRDPCMGPLL